MAREVVVTCDNCGKAKPSIKQYTVRTDGFAWEVELDDDCAKPLLAIANKGREVAHGSGGPRKASDQNSLEKRIRNVPDET